jgi:hypothetical protein
MKCPGLSLNPVAIRISSGYDSRKNQLSESAVALVLS